MPARAIALAAAAAIALVSVAPPASASPALPAAETAPVETVVPVLAVLLRDDDGKRPVAVTPAEVAAWVGEANAVWSAAGLRLAFDPATDVETVANSVLNGIGGPTSRDWAAESAAANAFAATRPGRLVLLFRWGPAAGTYPTTTSYAAATADFIAMPQFDTKVCGRQDLTLLAHEIGHWLGVPNTYPKAFKDHGDADAWLRARGGSPLSFDGDGWYDTLPDPFIADAAHQCSTSPTYDVNGSIFTMPRTNIMSAYPARHDLTPSQIGRARSVLEVRMEHPVSTPSNAGPPGTVAISGLDRKVTDATCTTVPPDPEAVSRWLSSKLLRCSAGAKATIAVTLPALTTPGPYRMTLYGGAGPDGATFRVLLDGKPVVETVDATAPVALPTGPIDMGSPDLGAGTHTITVEVTSVPAPSKPGMVVLDAVRLVPLSLPVAMSTKISPVRGGKMTVDAKTTPGARCTLTLPKAIAPTRGLPARVASDTGLVRWSWIIPRKAPPRTYAVTAVCTLDPASGRATLRFAVGP